MSNFRVLRLGTILTLLCLINAACGDEDETNTQAETQTETQANMGREGPVGCYIPGDMLCDCDIEEADCTMDVGVWTEGCETCAE
jgi:hypothetical protein